MFLMSEIYRELIENTKKDFNLFYKIIFAAAFR
jgi:hypothetical protein